MLKVYSFSPSCRWNVNWPAKGHSAGEGRRVYAPHHVLFLASWVHHPYNHPALNLSLPGWALKLWLGSIRKCGWVILPQMDWPVHLDSFWQSLTHADILSLVEDREGTEVLLLVDRCPGPPTRLSQCCLTASGTPHCHSLARTVPCCPVPARLPSSQNRQTDVSPRHSLPNSRYVSNWRSRSLIPKGMPGQVSGYDKLRYPFLEFLGNDWRLLSFYPPLITDSLQFSGNHLLNQGMFIEHLLSARHCRIQWWLKQSLPSYNL